MLPINLPIIPHWIAAVNSERSRLYEGSGKPTFLWGFGLSRTMANGREPEEAGVEPTEDAWRPPTGLKPARVTGPDTLPRRFCGFFGLDQGPNRLPVPLRQRPR